MRSPTPLVLLRRPWCRPALVALLCAMALSCACLLTIADARRTPSLTQTASPRARALPTTDRLVWDLSGATLQSIAFDPACDSTATPCTSYIARWTAPTIAQSSSTAAPPLQFTVFAEFNGRTTSLCQVQSDAAPHAAVLQCGIDGASLPMDAPIALQLLTECDHTLIDPPRWARSTPVPRCTSSLSPRLTVTLADLTAEAVAQMEAKAKADAALVDMQRRRGGAAAPGVRRVLRDGDMRELLCQFFYLTTGPNWTNSTNWCDTTVSVCDWFGITCDDEEAQSDEPTIIGLNLPSNNLSGNGIIDVNTYVQALTELEFLDFSLNMIVLAPLDLTPLKKLQVVHLAFMPGWFGQHVLFAEDNEVWEIDFSVSMWHFNHTGMPKLQNLILSSYQRPFQFQWIWNWPDLRMFIAEDSLLNTNEEATDGSGAIGGVLTQHILSRLYLTNLELRTLNIGSTTLSFDWRVQPSDDNWPSINAPKLETLVMTNLPQLRTGPAGPQNVLWLAGLGQIQQLDLSSLPGVHLTLTSFNFVSLPYLQTFTSVSTRLSGDLLDLLKELTDLQIDQAGLQSALPSNVSACWPKLRTLCACCNALTGNLPSFTNLPDLYNLRLQENDFFGPFPSSFLADSPAMLSIDVSVNYLSGSVPSFDANPLLYSLAFDYNNLSGSLPSFPNLSLLRTFSIASNALEGALPDDFWNNLAGLASIDLSNNDLQGTIPGSPQQRFFTTFQLSMNNFVGSLPLNIFATTFDVSQNALSGSLVFPKLPSTAQIQVLNVASQIGANMSCPIMLAHMTKLEQLDIHAAGFAGCDFNDFTQVQLPDGLLTLDISYNAWRPLSLAIPAKMQIMRAMGAGVVGLRRSGPKLQLQKLYIADAPFNFVSDTGDLQLVQWTVLLDAAAQLSVLQCINCSLSMDLTSFLPLISQSGPRPLFQELQLSNNGFTGTVPSTLFASNRNDFSLPRSTQIVDLSNNPSLGGQMPMATSGFNALTTINLSNTSISGVLPTTWGQFHALQQLVLQGTSLTCPLTLADDGDLHCELPAWIKVTPRPQDAFTPPTSIEPVSKDYHCPALSVEGTNFSIVTLDESYHKATLCDCNVNFFGKPEGHCVRCPIECDCSGDMVAGCYPIIVRGLVESDEFGNIVAGAPVTPFIIVAMLPCPRTTTGLSLCNPDKRPWQDFYAIAQRGPPAPLMGGAMDAANGSFHSSSSSPLRATDDAPFRGIAASGAGWCAEGHTSRLCARCSNGYFSSGRWCLRCMNVPTHVVLLVFNLAIGALLVVFLYRKSPGTGIAAAELTEYVAREQAAQRHVPFREHTAGASLSTSHITGGNGGHTNGALFTSDSGVWESPISTAASSAASVANPAKLLVFFTQQLSVLLRTSTSLPRVLAGLLTAVSATGSGFSFSSLPSLECLHTGWSLRAQCVGALAGPVLLGVVCLLIKFWKHKNVPPRLDAAVSESDFHALVQRASVQSKASRAYGVCLSSAYLLAFPSAYTCISALTCTDLREWHVAPESDSNDGRPTSHHRAPTPIFLNLYPGVQCDATWARTTLPLALAGVLFWFVAFPLGSTMFFRRMRRQAMTAPARERGGGEAAKAVAAWPVCADLLQPFKPQWWWWEQLLLARRLTLCAIVAIIPGDSVFLPLCLVLLFEFSALVQHYAQPYRHTALNVAELASLYLLLLNYISSVVFATAFSVGTGGFGTSEDVWASLLFAANLVFLLALLGALSSRVRSAYARARDAVKRFLAARGWTSRYDSSRFSAPPRCASPPSASSSAAPSSANSPPPSSGGRDGSFSPINLGAANNNAIVPNVTHSPKAARPPMPMHFRTAPEFGQVQTGTAPAPMRQSTRPRMVRDQAGVLRQVDYHVNERDYSLSQAQAPLLAGPSFSHVGSHIGSVSRAHGSGRSSPAPAHLLYQPPSQIHQQQQAAAAAAAAAAHDEHEREYFLQDH